MPAEPFDAAWLLSVRVHMKARVCVHQCHHSVPARLAGRRLSVRLSARQVEVLDGGTAVARHERALGSVDPAEVARLADLALRERLAHRAYLAELLAAEVDERGSRRIARRIVEARRLRSKRLADFDCSVTPLISPATLATLAAGAYLTSGDPVVLLGDSGTGKTCLLIGIGMAACEAGRRVRYTMTAAPVIELGEAR